MKTGLIPDWKEMYYAMKDQRDTAQAELSTALAESARLTAELVEVKRDLDITLNALGDSQTENGKLESELATARAERDAMKVPSDIASMLKKVVEERDSLRAEVKALREDGERLAHMERNCLTVECYDSPTPGGDDSQEMWRVIEYHMAKPRERYIGYGMTPRDAIDDARVPKDV